MENMDQNQHKGYGGSWDDPRPGRSGKVLAGLLLVVAGLLILAAKLHYFFLPYWVFSWQMLLIVLGLFIGFRQNFRRSGWLVLVLIGTVFLLDDLVVDFNLRVYFWPVLLIGIGLWVMLKPGRRSPRHSREAAGQVRPTVQPESSDEAYAASIANTSYTMEDVVDVTAILAGIKKSVISKNFRGGEVVSVFGGTELNLVQADMQQPAVLEATQIFGGTTLIVPPHWKVQSDMTAILGGVNDERPMMPGGYDPNKVLILKGLALFGGLNIKSY